VFFVFLDVYFVVNPDDMNLTIPIYIELLPEENQSTPVYSVRPLFFQEPVGLDLELQRALAKFAKAMRRKLDNRGREMRHYGLAAYSFAPEVDDRMLTLALDLKTRTARCDFLFVTLNGFARRIAFTPSLPHLWFDLERGEELHERAVQVLTAYFRGKEKSGGATIPKPEDVSVKHKAWSSTIEIEIHPPPLAKTPNEEFRAMLGGGETMDGESELQQVGRCLDWLHPDELSRVVAREKEVEELTRLLRSTDRRPVILLGARMVGKTAIIEEFVYRKVERQKSKFRPRLNVWLIAPQRLISGMSYVGQWENRLLAIIDEAKKRNHILYFDDLLGLFKAGLSRDASLNAAQVLKPYLERREVRVLGEITPEAWRVLREQDRGFADLFQILPVNEPDENSTIEMLLGLIRQLEHQNHCRFNLDSLPAAFDLQRRYVRDAAFPGKAAAFLRQLSVKYRGEEIGCESVLAEFRAKSGLAPWFIGDHTLRRAAVIEELEREVIGQAGAIEAVTDAVCVAKARLNDPDRPIASFLFLGPTGVGKTQCAKSLARYLFGDAERLIRFDMNEFISPGSVARLVGTFDQPEGLLTNAVRRQPFSVVLLDEVEKAHRDVFNLLLQVMGDGRLTDAFGRTADFTNVILILTSNLGVKEAASELGFGSQQINERSIYTQAAEKFFSPEFFNRLDRIVPFERLNREAVRQIAGHLISQLFQREGLARRRCVLNVEDRALARIIDRGFHPQLGARALKRAIENELAQPVARYLSSSHPTAPTVINVLPAPGGLRVEVQELVEATPSERSIAAPRTNLKSVLARIEEFIDRTEDETSELQPEGAISIDAVQPQHRRYFALREQIGTLRRHCDRLRNRIEALSRARLRLTRNLPLRRAQVFGHLDQRVRQVWKALFAVEDMYSYLSELTAAAKSGDEEFDNQLTEIICETALLSLLAQDDDERGHCHALVMFRFLERSIFRRITSLPSIYSDLFSNQLGMDVKYIEHDDGKFHPDTWLLVQGWEAVTLAEIEEGTQLFILTDEWIEPVQIKVHALEPDADPRRKIAEFEAKAAADEGFLKFDPVIRIHHQQNSGAIVDLRSGLTTTNFLSPQNLRAMMLSVLPLPPELEE
jgi:ATP-dependent Clp protease ATP-binding subunit ClpC